LHPKFDQQISLIQKIYGYSKDNFEKKEVTPLKLLSRPDKKFLPMISSENRKFKKLDQIQVTFIKIELY